MLEEITAAQARGFRDPVIIPAGSIACFSHLAGPLLHDGETAS